MTTKEGKQRNTVSDSESNETEAESSSVDHQIYCICRSPDDGTQMIGCDNCNEVFFESIYISVYNRF
jgi:hypothetical protein